MESLKPFSPLDDGKTHINVYSRGGTYLGRALSNFADIGIKHPCYGNFRTLEGFWHWLATGCCRDEFRELNGSGSKKFARTLQKIHRPTFQQEFELAIFLKLRQNPGIEKQVIESKIQFVHYYYYGNKDNARVVIPTGSEWFVDWIEQYRLKHQ